MCRRLTDTTMARPRPTFEICPDCQAPIDANGCLCATWARILKAKNENKPHLTRGYRARNKQRWTGKSGVEAACPPEVDIPMEQ